MKSSDTFVIFIIAAFSFALILILKKNSIPEKFRRPLAITALMMVVFAFFLIVYAFLQNLA
ncbi:hypothetical protein [Ferviditalea candida]|uniref:Signal transduction histidine kinase n=1 Tax=Ferviditalea candida TaxID=3108399 RepID=A0ABU5ZEZ9_9BACL|nr:hypothetical protein [Paenibacillaceae bacterium T2]